MLLRADLGKKFYTLGKDGKNRILTLTESCWSGEPCFTDGKEYYYLDGNKYGYDNDIIAYWPYGFSPFRRNLILSILIGIVLVWLGYCAGAIVTNATYLMEMTNV